MMLDYDKFIEEIIVILKNKSTPCWVCECGSKTWMYEGSFKEVYKKQICKICNKFRKLVGDKDAPEL